MILGRDFLLKPVLRRAEVDVPGGTAIVRELSLAEAAELRRADFDMTNPDDQLKAIALTIKMAWIDEHGNQIMQNDDDIDVLLAHPQSTLTKIATAIAELSGTIDSTDLLEQAKKN